MSFCVNCGQKSEPEISFCPACISDPKLVQEELNLKLAAISWKDPYAAHPRFGYPGEHGALIISITIAIAMLVAVGMISFGLAVLVVGIQLLYLYFDTHRFQQKMIAVSDTEFPEIQKLARLAAYRLNMSCPRIFVAQDPTYNAYTRGFGRYGFVVLHSALLKEFTPQETLFILGHEMGHMRKYHTTWLTLIHTGRGQGANFILAPLLGFVFNAWSVKCEYTADQAGMLACREMEYAVTTMLKLSSGPDAAKSTDLKRFLSKMDSDSSLDAELSECLGDHPYAMNRIRQLLRFSGSRVYRAAVA